MPKIQPTNKQLEAAKAANARELEMNDLARAWQKLTPVQKLEVFDKADQDMKRRIATEWRFIARPEQYRPTYDNWFLWLFLGGYGSGKTRAGAEWVVEQIKLGYNRIAIVGQTVNDVRTTMLEGPSGLFQALDREGIRYKYIPSTRRIVYKAQGKHEGMAITYSADKPDQFKGPAHDALWLDEQCKWTYPDAYQYLLTRARHGDDPRIFSSTTPERSPILDLQIPNMINARVEGSEVIVYDHPISDNPDAFIWVTQGRTQDNTALNDREKKIWEAQFSGTRMAEWALEGRILLDVPDAIWTPEMIDNNRIEVPKHNTIEELITELEIDRIVVAVDPAVTSGEKSDETGIVIAGISGKIAYILEDASCKLPPQEWCKKVVQLYHKWNADFVVIEKNNGGDFIRTAIQNIDYSIRVTEVWAKKGKVTRAEPIAALYEKGLVKHVGKFPKLENQMTAFTLDNRVIKSPDRVDALVYAVQKLNPGRGWDGTIVWV